MSIFTRRYPSAIRRIGVFHDKSAKFADAYWLTELEQHPEERYVSDGDPAKITFPGDELDGLAARFRSEANPY